ncbi:DUF427-domain-containing protein [Pterulicium gracile]|uniref:DUF427-domain-containing protein n=1 Tax=Pterulicium gracile TaxID=1884261 RepID=A0A5C3Q028_9AGAR|nr:DUF427-domain-containing protein [Pterula gracilis]
MPTISVTLNTVPIASADSSKVVSVEGNHYFPPDSINTDILKLESDTQTVCGWKGTAAYYNAHMPTGVLVKDVAWVYPTPKEKAANIKQHVAFYKNLVEFKEE